MERAPRRGTKSGNRLSWFEKWFLNNKFVTVLLITLLILLIVLVFSKISYLLGPVGSFFSVIGFPLIMAGIFFYMLNPLVTLMEKRGIKRFVGIWIAFVLVLLLMIWGFAILIPIIRDQTIGIIAEFPSYWRAIESMTIELVNYDWFTSLQEQISEINADIFNTVSEKLNEVLSNTVSGLGSVVGLLTNAFVGIVTMPIILYYLLKEGDKLPLSFLQFFPTNLRESIGDLLKKINTQISQYVRGQIIVAFFVGLMFVIGYAIVGMKFGIVLGILAGFLNIIPYMGSFIAMIPAVIVAIVDSPLMLAKVLLVFSIEQFIEGRVISPQVLGSNLEVHPVTIIFVLLTAGKLFGLTGFILGIPGYAVLKVLFMHIFEWYKEISGLYLDELEVEEEPDEDYPQE
ncbi:AI-2E family transporter [uncultured Trichococcus sp.]|uniref:AI-2E family transporter n=1 Tax=uncultured Trichococcus sp. TaxID=189665 RepID=UPI0029C8A99B|nr:AI-2E family transporter [uncultured Trichococcus sp.]